MFCRGPGILQVTKARTGLAAWFTIHHERNMTNSTTAKTIDTKPPATTNTTYCATVVSSETRHTRPSSIIPTKVVQMHNSTEISLDSGDVGIIIALSVLPAHCIGVAGDFTNGLVSGQSSFLAILTVGRRRTSPWLWLWLRLRLRLLVLNADLWEKS